MEIAILSDIHGNLNAFNQVYNRILEKKIDAIILLGDLIDYGMHSNEIIRSINSIEIPILCNIWGNHEKAILNNDVSSFSSERGKKCAKYTQSILDDFSVQYIRREMNANGYQEFTVEGKKCLAIHGGLKDCFWKSIDIGQNLEQYKAYDYVFSGHSHLPHFHEAFFKSSDEILRYKKKTIFVNPGSVGQPRNHNNRAQYAILNTETEAVSLDKIPYDIAEEQRAYCGQVDDFYKIRLERGI